MIKAKEKIIVARRGERRTRFLSEKNTIHNKGYVIAGLIIGPIVAQTKVWVNASLIVMQKVKKNILTRFVASFNNVGIKNKMYLIDFLNVCVFF